MGGNESALRAKEIEDLANGVSSSADTSANVDSGELMELFQYERAPPAIVHHYIPSNFPMMPVFSPAYLADCTKTWKHILLANTDRMKEYGKPGIVLFYDEFFYRLFQRDPTIEEVFQTIRSRGETLIRVITTILKSTADNNAQLINKCRYLGHRHRYFPRIRPYHFATYCMTLIEVMMFWLGEFATPDVAEAWSNSVCFFMKHMLESMLSNRVDPFEHYQNTTLEALRDITDSEQAKSESHRSARTGRSGNSARSADKLSARG